MNTYLRPSAQRGHVNFGWLDARHTFSFGNYYDPAHMQFGPLRVINEDHIAPRSGFPTHPHQNMEIITYVIGGKLSHRDSTGGEGSIEHGQIQVMSAGMGIRHSEFNASAVDPVHLLQIWIEPQQLGLTPRYEDRAFPLRDGLTLLVSGSGRDGSAQVAQKVELHRLLGQGAFDLELKHGSAFVQVVSGTVQIGEHTLAAGDGIGVRELSTLNISAEATDGKQPEGLIFDIEA